MDHSVSPGSTTTVASAWMSPRATRASPRHAPTSSAITATQRPMCRHGRSEWRERLARVAYPAAYMCSQTVANGRSDVKASNKGLHSLALAATMAPNVTAHDSKNEPWRTKLTDQLTERQSKILEFIRYVTRHRNYPPSVREIGEAVGLSSSSTVHNHLNQLERRGLIKRDPSKSRTVQLVADADIDQKRRNRGRPGRRRRHRQALRAQQRARQADRREPGLRTDRDHQCQPGRDRARCDQALPLAPPGARRAHFVNKPARRAHFRNKRARRARF